MQTLNLQTQMDFAKGYGAYFNVNIPLSVVQPYLSFLKKMLPTETYLDYVHEQEKRDGKKHHLTIINPIEYKKKYIDQKKEMPPEIIHYPIEIKTIGIGRIVEVK